MSKCRPHTDALSESVRASGTIMRSKQGLEHIVRRWFDLDTVLGRYKGKLEPVAGLAPGGAPTRRKPKFRERNAGELEPSHPVRPTRERPPPPPRQIPQTPRSGSASTLALFPTISVEQGLYVALTGVAFILRFWDIGSRAMHGDESVHAWLAWNLYNGTGYQYDPVYHGPLQFLVTSVFFFLFGVSNTTARLMAVLFGTAMIGLLYLLRPYLGRTAALIAAFFVCISPAFVYVSRLERDDIFTSLFAVLLAISIFSFVRTRRIRYVYLAAAVGSLSLSAMENTYITLFVFGTYLALVLAGEALATRSPSSLLMNFVRASGPDGVIHGRILAAGGLWLLVAFAITVATGWYLPVPLVAAIAIVLLVLRQSSIETASRGETPFLDAIRGVNRAEWINAGVIVLAILVLTFSTFGSNLRGIWDSTQPFFHSTSACPGNSFFLNPCRKDIVGGLFYWLSQHKVARGGQPWFYYGLLDGLYEQIAVFFGIAGIVASVRRPSMFTSFLVYWAVLMFGVYSWAGEKFSWLMIHPLMPLLLLGAAFVAGILRASPRVRYSALVALAVLLLIQIHNTFEVNFVNAADPVEMMVYVQSSPDTPHVASNIAALSNKVTNGPDLHVTIDADDTWPFAWYLRDMSNVAYPSPQQLTQKPYISNPVQIIDETHRDQVAPYLARSYTSHLYTLRWWFPENYKTWTWSAFARRVIDPASWADVSRWEATRKAFGPKGMVRFYYYVKRGLASPY